MISQKAAALFSGWNETLIWSCLQGCMGELLCDDEENPQSAVIDIGDFCFLAGAPNEMMLRMISGFKLIVPQNEEWERMIEVFFGDSVRRFCRYAIKKEPNIFDTQKLELYVQGLSGEYELRLFDREIYDMAMSEPWSRDMCAQFEDYCDYAKRGIGVAILHDGRLASGASSYTVYNEGIEIEIDTRLEYRERGLATICASSLILECLKRGLYPSWDAHDLRSVALAQKLGYHMDRPYVTYELK